MLKRRQSDIKAKGFDMTSEGVYTYSEAMQEEDIPYESRDFAQMRIGLRTMDDVLVNVGNYRKTNRNFGDKNYILRAISRHDYKALREISNYYYENSGIYYRLCKYLASMYRFDWYVTPYSDDWEKQNQKKLLKNFNQVLAYLDKSEIKRTFYNITLDIIKEGAFYGIIVQFDDRFAVQKLPADYCRCRYYSGPDPIVELNLQFFDSYFPNPQYKVKILKTFPVDIQKAYVLWKEGKLEGDYPGAPTCWVPLDPGTSVKLSLSNGNSGGDFPCLIGTIPSIIDLDQAQELDRQKTMQQLVKIIVQKLPLDKNSDLIFDVDEAKDIHNNAVAMLKRSVGVDVLTTFADVDEIDTKDSESSTSSDDLEKVERTVYNNSGISSNLFNADGNLAVTNSILADEAAIRDIPAMFAAVLNRILERFKWEDHYEFRANILETTQFNYKEVSKLFKEQTQIGFSKILPQIALGHSQSSIYASIQFETQVLHLTDIMIPPMSSNTMSSETILGSSSQSNSSQNQSNQTESSEVGRPELDDSEKSDKTLQNEESAS